MEFLVNKTILKAVVLDIICDAGEILDAAKDNIGPSNRFSKVVDSGQERLLDLYQFINDKL